MPCTLDSISYSALACTTGPAQHLCAAGGGDVSCNITLLTTTVQVCFSASACNLSAVIAFCTFSRGVATHLCLFYNRVAKPMLIVQRPS